MVMQPIEDFEEEIVGDDDDYETGNGNYKYHIKLSMTQLLTHTVAHSIRSSYRPKTNNQPTKKFLSLGAT